MKAKIYAVMLTLLLLSIPVVGGKAADVPDVSRIFAQEGTGADDCVARLLATMEKEGQPFHAAKGKSGVVAKNDVVLIKINSQWDERGGTNTDLLRAVIQAVLDHPDGFSGEIVVADNGQAQYGSAGSGGSLDWDKPNSADRATSALDVVNTFKQSGAKVSGMLWDVFTKREAAEFDAGDNANGFIVVPGAGFPITYPKFTTEYGTRISFKRGIWDGTAYDGDLLKIINMPVLKSHWIYQVTGAVKNYMGVVSDKLTRGGAHKSVGTGGMGVQMAGTRMPALNILDMIYIGAGSGPGVPYGLATQKNMVAASTDPVALDYWASKHVLMPEAKAVNNKAAASMDPDGAMPGTFGYWLRLSALELQKAGIRVTMDEAQMRIVSGS